MRILHAPADVGGHAHGLAMAERELGHRSDVAVFSPGPYGYDADIDLRAGIERSLPTRFARRACFLALAATKYDTFHFNFGQTLLQVRQLGRVIDELALLRKLGKTVLVTYQGCDVRPFARCFCRNTSCAAESPYRQPAADRVLRLAHHVYYLNPDLAQWLPGATFLPYASVDPRAITPAPAPADRNEVVVLHAPTNRAVKGSVHVIAAVEALRREGLSVRLDLVEGVHRDEVLRRIAAADIVVDQLMIPWYGGVAVEAMALARPVVCAIGETDNPFGDDLPIVRAEPATVSRVLRELALDPERRRRVAVAGRAFTERVHDPRTVARTLLAECAGQ